MKSDGDSQVTTDYISNLLFSPREFKLKTLSIWTKQENQYSEFYRTLCEWFIFKSEIYDKLKYLIMNSIPSQLM